MGGRVASMVADELHAAGAIAGLLCLGYPVPPAGQAGAAAHPPPRRPRARPTLICQGTRDPFGTREEVAGYALSDRIEILWLEDGDHDLQAAQGRHRPDRRRPPGDDGRRAARGLGRRGWA